MSAKTQDAGVLVNWRCDRTVVVSPDSLPLAVLGLITARHARTAWKYGGIACALELKDAGVIMHALQLAAVALGLGMCP